jgi:hypothetical protein
VSEFKKGQYVACRHNGTGNGDLIVGRIQSVRSSGHVICQNLLTGVTSTKLARVLRKRNFLVSKKEAYSILAAGSAVAARAAAVALYCKRQAAAPRRIGRTKETLQHRVSRLERVVESLRVSMEKLFLEEIPA